MSDPRQHEKYEQYEGGSPQAERLVFAELAERIVRVQRVNQDKGRLSGPERAFHAKASLGVDNARLRFHPDLPLGLREGYAQPGAEYRALVRLSNASGIPRPDAVPDLRGIAVSVLVSDDERHDLLMTNAPVSHAANAREFVDFAEVMAGAGSTAAIAWRLLVRLPRVVGRPTAARMRRTLNQTVARKVASLAEERYWSRAPILWGDAGPVRYQLRPGPSGPPAARPDRVARADPGYLRAELARRLRARDVVFELCLQRFADETRTPVEDASAEWPETVSPPVAVGLLTIPRQDIDSTEALATARRVEQLSFTPWRTTETFRPLGNLNRSREAVYGASSARRLGQE
ncbi:hypothetical protein [Streptomyces sp. CBMA152]|uniref:hypothetical protein n=1 Tax=Streptomyces sp. CBMA152 TaxID=1896312 RepID=UPI00166078E5|nr:hypothetical protein [Streptomyces sp. CBMA152]MBD0747881.1 hypothetical protein [Streptomyces sp. CBMA152]